MKSDTDATTTAIVPKTWPRLSDEDQFSRIMEASPSALVLVGQAGRIEMVNRQAERMFGYDRAELHGKPLELLLPERFRGRHVDLRLGFLTNMSSRVMGEGRDLFGLRKDGAEFPLEIGLNPIDFDGESMVLAGIIDVTARFEAERSQKQMRELERSNSDLEEFAYAASHDLKAPLRAISHLVQWIGDDIAATASPDTLENLRLLRGRATRLQMLLDGLLAYSRVGRQVQSAIETVDISEVVRDVATMLAPPPGFVVIYQGTTDLIRTERLAIQMVLENLIGNGLKHHDRAEGCITVDARRADGAMEFRVTDDGPGIDPRFHDRVFVIFQTLASRDDVESSGIGLAIVKKKVLAHGGRVWIESAPPARGTTFAFTWKETV
jgi:PAS domain S-box-containing protein